MCPVCRNWQANAVDDHYLHFERQQMTADERAETVAVQEYARALRSHLRARADAIVRAHVHGAGSSAIQRIIEELLIPLGFESERRVEGVTEYAGYARADLYRALGPGRGVIVEVERGGTVTNNHDLKDFWKTHIATNAHHLFLVVPVVNWSASGDVRERPFRRMHPRFVSFFRGDSRDVDVLSLHVFGYGPDTRLDSVRPQA